MECMCAQTRPRFIVSSERVLGKGVRTYVNSKGKNSLYRGFREGLDPRRSITQDSESNTLTIKLLRLPLRLSQSITDDKVTTAGKWVIIISDYLSLLQMIKLPQLVCG